MRRLCVSGPGGTTPGHLVVETTIIGGKIEYTYVGGEFSGTDETEDVRAAWQFMLAESEPNLISKYLRSRYPR